MHGLFYPPLIALKDFSRWRRSEVGKTKFIKKKYIYTSIHLRTLIFHYHQELNSLGVREYTRSAQN